MIEVIKSKIPVMGDIVYLFNPKSKFWFPTWIEASVTSVDMDTSSFETDDKITYELNGDIYSCFKFGFDGYQIVWFDNIKRLPTINKHYNKHFKKDLYE